MHTHPSLILGRFAASFLAVVFTAPALAQDEGTKQKGAHTPMQADEHAIPYADTKRLVQEYKPMTRRLRALAPDAAKTTESVTKAVARVIDEELADRKLATRAPVVIRVGPTWRCTFKLSYNGVPLAERSDVMCVMSADGQITMLRERGIPRAVGATKPTVEAKAATDLAQTDFTRSTKQEKATSDEPGLEIWVDERQTAHLCWALTINNGSETDPHAAKYWIAATDAPKVVAVENLIHHDHFGATTGTGWTTSPFQGTSTLPLGLLDVSRAGTSATTRPTGFDGRYSFIPGLGNATISGTLAGQYCVITNRGPGGGVLARSGTGNHQNAINLFFNTADDFEVAQVTAFHWTNETHEFAKDFLLPSHLYNLPTRVNIDSSCNAFFSRADVSINFFRQVPTVVCPNTAYADVIAHEYGHAVDFVHGGIRDSGFSEGFGDALAILLTRQPCVGREFFGRNTCLRDARDLVLWPPTGGVHNQGRIFAGFTWELIQQLLLNKECGNAEDAISIAKRLILTASVDNPADIQDAVLLTFLADDDDGDLLNGTPHFRELAAAADSRRIPRPADPQLDRLPPRAAYEGCNGTHHIAQRAGTAVYCWKHNSWLTTLHYERTDNFYHYYCEKEYPDYRWAIAKTPDYCRTYSVWFLPGGETGGNWVFFHRAIECRSVNGTPQVSRTLRP